MTATEAEALEAFLEYLSRLGYPDTSLGVGSFGGGSEGFRADISVSAPKFEDPLAVFELKVAREGEETRGVIRRALDRQFPTYKDLLPRKVPLYFVIAKGNSWEFQVYRVRQVEGEEDPILEELPRPPPYRFLLEGRRDAEVRRTEKDGETLGRSVAWWARGIAAVLLLLLVAEYRGYYRFDAGRITILGLIIALLLLPFLSEFSVLGIRMKRLEQ